MLYFYRGYFLSYLVIGRWCFTFKHKHPGNVRRRFEICLFV